MRVLNIVAAFFLSLCCFTNGYSQLIVNAGADTAYCASDWEEARLGGNPSALGGTEPYTYAWSAEYEYAGNRFSASFLLADTTVANPVLTGPFNDSVTFYLKVVDADLNEALDSVKVRFSSFVVCLGECRHEITSGDSVQLWHCVSGGITPYQYTWTPEETLNDPNVEDPWAKPLVNTSYELMITDSIGCHITSNCTVFVSPAHVERDPTKMQIVIFPNPAQESITFQFADQELKNPTLQLFSVNGRLILETEICEPEISLDLRNLPSGVCFYKLVSENQSPVSGKFVIE